MYLRHFALTRLPFETPAHTDELFDSNSRREAETRLNHLIELRGIGLLTGEVGSGKTTVCRHVTTVLHPGLYRLCYVSLTTGNVLDMYKSIAWELGLPTERSRATAYLHVPPRPMRVEKHEQIRGAIAPIFIVDRRWLSRLRRPWSSSLADELDRQFTTYARIYAANNKWS